MSCEASSTPIGYLIPEFPGQTHIFFWREIQELRQLGVTLKAGRVVTTGTCHAPLPIQSGDFCTADFGVLGKVSVGFK